MPVLLPLLGAAVAGGTAVTAYAVAETRRFVLREATVPVLPRGHAPVRVLHLSDLHLTPGQRRKQDWVRDLASLEPDLVVDTGDHLSHRESVPHVLDALGGLLEVPGVFVLGSNDYFEPTLRNPLRYLLPDDGTRHVDSPRLPVEDLTAGLTGAGWLDLTNTRGSLVVGDLRFDFAGVDDPHLEYDRLDEVAGRPTPTPTCGSASRTRRTSACSTSSPATGTTRCWPATPTAARSACPVAARSPPTATSSRPARRGCTATRRTPATAIRGRPGCTSRPVSGRRRTPRSGCPAGPRRPS